MTGDEFRSRVLAALDEPCTDDELAEYSCQCAADLAQPILARIERIAAEDGCPHASASGIDETDGPDKVWECDSCAFRYRHVPVGDGSHRMVPV